MNKPHRKSVEADDRTVPAETDIAGALATFAAAARTSLHAADIYRLGPAGSGYFNRDPDVEVAVVFAEPDMSEVDRVVRMGELAFDVFMSHGILVRGHPVAARDWKSPRASDRIAVMKSDCVRVG